MVFVAYKKFGNKEYAYEMKSYWDKKTKQPRHKSKYLGVVLDKDKKIFKKTLRERFMKDEIILDFGDTFLLYEFIKKEGFINLLKTSFGDDVNTIINLIFYKLCYPSAMRLAEIWQNGNVIKHLCKADLQSQRISELLADIGDELKYRKFFENYIPFIRHSSNGLVLDITAMPNQIQIPVSEWGYGDECIDKQIKLMAIIDKASSMPLFFRYTPGSISDVSCLEPTIIEMKKFGINDACCVFDAGFYSKNNIESLQEKKISFVVRLPAGTVLYRELIDKSGDIENMKYALIYGKRGLFVKKHKINLFGKKSFAYLILDPERKGRETKKLILKAGEEDGVEKIKNFILRKKGFMILLSSIDLSDSDVLTFYYSRYAVEQLFKFSKDDLKLLPLRTHMEESMRGYLLLIFITLSLFLLLKKRLGKTVSVEESLLQLRNIKAKVYKDEIIIPEMTKKQRLLFEKFDIIVPKTLGI